MNNIYKKIDDWDFSKKLCEEFLEHIKKSIPNYELINEDILNIFEFICPKDSKVLELGCSTGDLIKCIHDLYLERNISFDAYEIEKEMYEYAKKNIGDRKINIFNKDLLLISDIEKYDVALSIFTMQFLNFEKRKKALRNIFNSLKIGGNFLLAEKIISDDTRTEKMLSSMLYEFKRNKGISDEDIIKKELSLRGVMHCKTNKEIMEEIKITGFSSIEMIQKNNSFALYIIRK